MLSTILVHFLFYLFLKDISSLSFILFGNFLNTEAFKPFNYVLKLSTLEMNISHFGKARLFKN